MECFNAVEDLVIKSNKNGKPVCKPCIVGNAHRLSFPGLHQRASNVLDVAVSDLGYSDTASIGDTKWIVVFIDEHLHYIGVSFL